jgi:hypothetical protein
MESNLILELRGQANPLVISLKIAHLGSTKL